MSKWLAITAAVVLGMGLSACTTTQNLTTNMQSLSTNYKLFESSTDQQEALQALKNMQTAALASQKQRPVSLPKASTHAADFKAYQGLYTELNAEIVKAQALTEAGQLDQAKQHLKNMDAIKKQGHQRYKP